MFKFLNKKEKLIFLSGIFEVKAPLVILKQGYTKMVQSEEK